ncbi:AtpF [Schleiferilactobacillus shenzhenensis LY-73]|uniref:ATP synthase subunit b n=1 Tax=Schleiferilactobacillus shenzhenensis LY-73 TaxID=1231336 RepID=U4TNG9_9LACO|nr:AtpF [Schleiferilactobacillus shenzhenensis LY-73]
MILATTGLYTGDLLWYLILFAVLLVAVGHFAWNPVNDMMEKRRNKINDDIDHAQSARQTAEEQQKKTAAALADSKNQAVAIISKAQQQGSAQQDQIIAQAHTDAETMKKQAEKDAAQARQDALAHAKDDIADLSVQIASKLINKELDASAHQQLIDSYIKGLDNNNGQTR